MDGNAFLKSCHFRHGREKSKSSRRLLKTETRFPGRTNSFKVSYSQKINLM
ncbi:AEL_HP2_G0050280.mRNA.1.CDS.1 [Saccharomyces cerevisiae]|nr:AEL_HP2_G0050280.mRNA.1.CDS.1 [Saccharomyces cerevisiae]CAI6796959.1 AEL_HP2_G0050280.mRNA.1.CDS.1 [Saccharomyces cerevisiae]